MSDYIKMSTNLIPVFGGTYGNIWDDIADYTDNGEEICIQPSNLIEAITDLYKNNTKYILSEIVGCGVDFITEFKITGGYYSPREYNFHTNTIDVDIKVNRRKLLNKARELCNSDDFTNYLHDNYTSMSGFISYTPNNKIELLEQLETQGDEYEQSIGAIITYLLGDTAREIELRLWEDWCGNGYGILEYDLICGECGKVVIK